MSGVDDDDDDDDNTDHIGEGEEQCDYTEARAARKNLEESDQAEAPWSCEYEAQE